MTSEVAPTLIRGARVFDGERMRTPTQVLLRDGLIAEVCDRISAPAECAVVDGTGQTLLPGLIDAHTHVFAGRLEQALAFGVTTELDMFANPTTAADLKAHAEYRLDMADVRSAGTGATAPGGHPTQLVDRGLYPVFPTVTGSGEAERFVVDRVAEGSDYLKVFLDAGVSMGMPLPTLDQRTVAALVTAGHAHGLLVIAHVTDLAAAHTAIEAGVDGLAHVVVDAEPPSGWADTAAAAGVFVIPTLTVIDGMWGDAEGAQALARDQRVAPYLDSMSTSMLGMGGFAPPEARHGPTHARAAVRALRAAGVSILAGTDASNPGTAHGASLHHELRLLIEAGLTPLEALTAATAAPAARFGLADRGRISPGLLADLVLVDGDPSRDITATTAITGVWRRGARLDRGGYAAALTPTATATPAVGAEAGLDPVAGTALWTAADRARESARPDRLFDDPLAAVLAGEPGHGLAEQMRGDGTFDNPAVVIRTRFFDDVITDAVISRGLRQVVLVAAGMDTRAYRLELPADVAWFELDRPPLLERKARELAAADAPPRGARYPIGVDLAGDWPAALIAAGFAAQHPALWLVEGLLPYLTAAAVQRLFDQITDLAAPGSELLCDPVGQSMLDSQWVQPWLEQLAVRGVPWRFGTDRPEDLLEPRGWTPTVSLLSTVGSNLGRWPFPAYPRDTPGVPQSYLVHATR